MVSTNPPRHEGRIAIVTIRGVRDAVDVGSRSTPLCVRTNASITDGEIVWSWRPGADAQRNARNAHCRDTGAREPVPEEITYKP